MDKEICICAAVLTKDGIVVRGNRHIDCFYTIKRMGKEPDHRPHAQGFITSRNRFVGRVEGMRLQNEAMVKSVDTGDIIKDGLFSEDLY